MSNRNKMGRFLGPGIRGWFYHPFYKPSSRQSFLFFVSLFYEIDYSLFFLAIFMSGFDNFIFFFFWKFAVISDFIGNIYRNANLILYSSNNYFYNLNFIIQKTIFFSAEPDVFFDETNSPRLV